MEVVYQVFAAGLALVVLIYTWKILNWAYITPRRLEKGLRKQGLKGNSYRFVYGDFKEIMQSIMESRSKPINIDDDIKPRVQAFFINTIRKYGIFIFIFFFFFFSFCFGFLFCWFEVGFYVYEYIRNSMTLCGNLEML